MAISGLQAGVAMGGAASVSGAWEMELLEGSCGRAAYPLHRRYVNGSDGEEVIKAISYIALAMKIVITAGM